MSLAADLNESVSVAPASAVYYAPRVFWELLSRKKKMCGRERNSATSARGQIWLVAPAASHQRDVTRRAVPAALVLKQDG